MADPAAAQRPARDPIAWALGIALGVLALGPALGPGSLLNLDLITSPDIPVPAGAWGLGPELPRRVPLYLPIAWIGSVVGGDVVVKALMVLIVALAVTGVARMLRDLPILVRMGAGALYGLSPFLLTRLEVGHLTIALATAVLPWVVAVLLDPGRSGARTLRCAAAMGCAGPQGGVLVAVLLLTAWAAGRRRRVLVALGAAAVGQLPWLVPGIIVWAQGSSPAAADDFPTAIDGPLDVLGLLAGHGFWQRPLQLGWSSDAVVAALGTVLLLLAAAGWSAMPVPWRRPLAIMASLGATVALAGAIPGIDGAWGALTSTPPGAVLREGQRMLPLLLLPLHLAAAHGAVALARRGAGTVRDVLVVAPAAIALVASAPALWGLGDAITPVRWPEEWAEAKAVVAERPGTVAVLPWHLYLDISWTGGRRMLNPAPLYLGGDVLTSSDPGFGSAVQERGDPRESTMAAMADRSTRGQSIAAELEELGVRWVILLHEANWEDHRSLLLDRGLRTVIDGPSLTVLAVRGWRGAAVDGAGRPVALQPLIGPLARLDPGARAVLHRGGGWGWRRGTEPLATDEMGLAVAPAGSGPLWYPPAVAVLAGNAVTLATLGATVSRSRRWISGVQNDH